MLRIGDFSKLARVSIRMLRHYDQIGLLIPAQTDPFTGYRYYAEAQLTVASRIGALKDMGFGLAAIDQMLKSYDDPEKLAEYLRLKQLELEEESEKTKDRLILLESMILRLGKDDQKMKYDVMVKELPQREVASVRDIIPAYNQEGLLWQTLMSEIGPLNVQDGDPCYTLAIFHDGEHKEENVDVEVQKSIRGSYANTEHVVFKMQQAVLVASCTFKGSYDQCSEVSESVANWIASSGYDFAGTSFFIYHVSPYETQNPDEFVTEICYPVRKK
ncbi:MAG: MerR family transcriptional regulator [Clostridiales bacterium]|nr:MerR family transcriptional regulator [Clostridiales bacterium]